MKEQRRRRTLNEMKENEKRWDSEFDNENKTNEKED